MTGTKEAQGKGQEQGAPDPRRGPRNPRRATVPHQSHPRLSCYEIDGVRKEKERLTAVGNWQPPCLTGPLLGSGADRLCLLESRSGGPWMQRLGWSLSRLVTQDIKTQPQINHYIGWILGVPQGRDRWAPSWIWGPLLLAWRLTGVCGWTDLGPPALGLAVDRVLANHSLSSTASQGRSNNLIAS